MEPINPFLSKKKMLEGFTIAIYEAKVLRPFGNVFSTYQRKLKESDRKLPEKHPCPIPLKSHELILKRSSFFNLLVAFAIRVLFKAFERSCLKRYLFVKFQQNQPNGFRWEDV